MGGGFLSNWGTFTITDVTNSLQVYLGAIRSDILGSCKKTSCVKDNLTPMERSNKRPAASPIKRPDPN